MLCLKVPHRTSCDVSFSTLEVDTLNRALELESLAIALDTALQRALLVALIALQNTTQSAACLPTF